MYAVAMKDSGVFQRGRAYLVIEPIDGGGFAICDGDGVQVLPADFCADVFRVYDVLEILECVEPIKPFTVGKCYPVLYWVEGGAAVVDDEGREHWLSGLYGLAKFKGV